MDWRTVQFDWNRARAFLVTAEEGTFSAAARALELTQPTIGRQVASLEEELGVTLFERVGNDLELTEAGLELLEHVRAMGDAASRVSLSAAGQSTSIEGTVIITASEAIAAYLLPSFISEFRREYPGVEFELVVSNEPRDLTRREADIAIRNFQPNQPDLFARKVGESIAYMYASPSYLESVGGIETVEDVERAEILAFDRTSVMTDGLARLGLNVTERQFPIVTSNHLVQWQICRQGGGICIMMCDVGDPEPAVERVLPQIAIPVPLWIVSHRELRTSRRIRLVFDSLAEALASP